MFVFLVSFINGLPAQSYKIFLQDLFVMSVCDFSGVFVQLVSRWTNSWYCGQNPNQVIYQETPSLNLFCGFVEYRFWFGYFAFAVNIFFSLPTPALCETLNKSLRMDSFAACWPETRAALKPLFGNFEVIAEGNQGMWAICENQQVLDTRTVSFRSEFVTEV